MQKNRIELAGHLAAKPSVRYLPSGTPVANVRMAEGYRYTDRNKQSQEHTNWHSLVFYGELAIENQAVPVFVFLGPFVAVCVTVALRHAHVGHRGAGGQIASGGLPAQISGQLDPILLHRNSAF